MTGEAGGGCAVQADRTRDGWWRHAHSRSLSCPPQILHRDLKLENVLLTGAKGGEEGAEGEGSKAGGGSAAAAAPPPPPDDAASVGASGLGVASSRTAMLADFGLAATFVSPGEGGPEGGLRGVCRVLEGGGGWGRAVGGAWRTVNSHVGDVAVPTTTDAGSCATPNRRQKYV